MCYGIHINHTGLSLQFLGLDILNTFSVVRRSCTYNITTNHCCMFRPLFIVVILIMKLLVVNSIQFNSLFFVNSVFVHEVLH